MNCTFMLKRMYVMGLFHIQIMFIVENDLLKSYYVKLISAQVCRGSRRDPVPVASRSLISGIFSVALVECHVAML